MYVEEFFSGFTYDAKGSKHPEANRGGFYSTWEQNFLEPSVH